MMEFEYRCRNSCAQNLFLRGKGAVGGFKYLSRKLIGRREKMSGKLRDGSQQLYH